MSYMYRSTPEILRLRSIDYTPFSFFKYSPFKLQNLRSYWQNFPFPSTVLKVKPWVKLISEYQNSLKTWFYSHKTIPVMHGNNNNQVQSGFDYILLAFNRPCILINSRSNNSKYISLIVYQLIRKPIQGRILPLSLNTYINTGAYIPPSH